MLDYTNYSITLFISEIYSSNEFFWFFFSYSNFSTLINLFIVNDPLTILFMLIYIFLSNNIFIYYLGLKSIPFIFIIIYIGAIAILSLSIIILINFRRHVSFPIITPNIPDWVILILFLFFIQNYISTSLIIFWYFFTTFVGNKTLTKLVMSNNQVLLTLQLFLILLFHIEILFEDLSKILISIHKKIIFIPQQINYFIENNELNIFSTFLYETYWLTTIFILILLIITIIACVRILIQFF